MPGKQWKKAISIIEEWASSHWFVKSAWNHLKGEWRFMKGHWLSLVIIAVFFFVFGYCSGSKITAQSSISRETRHKHEIVEKLGQFLHQGERFEAMCVNPKEQFPSDEVDAWAHDLDSYLARELGASYATRVKSSSGLLPESVTNLAPGVEQGIWWGIHVRCVRLNQFLDEMSR
jgi:hypothetical protein